MIISRNNSHGGIIRFCIEIFTIALRNKKNVKFSIKNTLPYLHSVSLVIWPHTLMKRTHFSDLSISRFSTYTKKVQGWTLHFRTPEKRKIPAQNDRAATNPTQNPSTYTVVSFQFTINSIFPVQPTLSRSLLKKKTSSLEVSNSPLTHQPWHTTVENQLGNHTSFLN